MMIFNELFVTTGYVRIAQQGMKLQVNNQQGGVKPGPLFRAIMLKKINLYFLTIQNQECNTMATFSVPFDLMSHFP